MQFTKVFSIIALAASTSAIAIPEPVDVGSNQGPVSANSTLVLFTNAMSTVVTGLTNTNDANVKVVNGLVANYVASAESNAALTAAAIASVVGQTSAYAKSLETLLTTLTLCVTGSASGGASASS